MLNIKLADLRIGHIFQTNEGGVVRVVSIVNNRSIGIKHNDVYGHEAVVELSSLNRGAVKNPYHPSVFGVGYLGVGSYRSSIGGNHTHEYTIWRWMLERCYSEKYHIRRPDYIGCTVDGEWHNFQNFANWYVNHPNYAKGYELDKDILYPGNKTYSPHRCVLVPSVVNSLFRDTSNSRGSDGLPVGVSACWHRWRVKCGRVEIGSYATLDEAIEVARIAKMNHILSLAERYKYEVGEEVYYAMLALAYTY